MVHFQIARNLAVGSYIGDHPELRGDVLVDLWRGEGHRKVAGPALHQPHCHLVAKTVDRTFPAMRSICLVQDTHRCDYGLLATLWPRIRRPVSPRIVEQFSQYFSFQHLLLLKENGALSRNTQELKRYVEITLREEAKKLSTLLSPRVISPKERYQHASARATMSGEILNSLYGDREERLQIGSMLTLALSNQQKDMVAHLIRHPYLSQPDLLTLLYPESQNERLLTRQITPLVHLGLIAIYPWDEAPSWRAHERYYLAESMLRFFALRHGLSPAYYLHPIFPKEEKRRPISPLSRKVIWLQQGARLLKQQMPHTDGLYTCIRQIFLAAHRGAPYRINYWKSAQESMRWYQDPFNREKPVSSIRPDAELLYTEGNTFIPRPLLIEYDRGTTALREYRRKMRCYADYQHVTRTTLPPLLFILRDERAAHQIRKAIAAEKAFDVQVMLVSEAHVLREGLLPVLDQLR